MLDEMEEERRRKIKAVVAVFFISLAFLAASSFTFDYKSGRNPIPYLSDGSGYDWNHLFTPECHPKRFQNCLRMEQTTFFDLVDTIAPFMERSELRTSYRERVAFFINYIAHPDTQSGLYESSGHAPEYISKTIHEVVDALYEGLRFADFSPPNVFDENPPFRLFNGCVGALNGTHIPIAVPFGGVGGWRNRKGVLSQNVFGCGELRSFRYFRLCWM